MTALAPAPIVTVAPPEIGVNSIIGSSPRMPIGETDMIMPIDQARTDTGIRAVDTSRPGLVAVAADTSDASVFNDDGAIA